MKRAGAATLFLTLCALIPAQSRSQVTGINTSATLRIAIIRDTNNLFLELIQRMK